MGFRISGLAPEPFQHLFGLSDAQLATRGALRIVVDHCPGFPDRIEMCDAAVGEHVILLSHEHQPADTPYRARHAIYVREGATTRYVGDDVVPDVLRTRLLSLRAFDAAHLLVDADVVDGRELETAITRLFADARVAYLHAHNAKPGCYAGRIDRAA